MSTIFKLYLTLLCSTAVNLEHTGKNRVFRGHPLSHDDHKYLVKLELVNQYESGSFCSGSILSPCWIITAAHCIMPDVLEIKVKHFIRGHMKVIGNVESKNIIWHPKYDFSNVISNGNRALDVVLLKTRKVIKFNEYVQPIMLATTSPRVGQLAVMAGYGENEISNREATEGAVVLTECNQEGLLCSKGVATAGDGDSGGSLVVRGHLVGVTSSSCLHPYESTPCLTVFVDVAHNVMWIKEVIERF